MTYLDRDYGNDAEQRGRLARFFARVVENPENPLGWSVRMFTIDGIAARIHLVTIVYFVAMILSSIAWGNIGFFYMCLAMGSLFVIVLLHEFGHCYAARFVGGEADRIVLLPFGGLALTSPPHEARAYFISVAGGPAVNAALFPLFALGLWAIGRPDTIITFNPFLPGDVIASFGASSTALLYAKIALWWLHYTNIIIFAFNVFLPMFPLDGGRMVQGLVWSRRGYIPATRVAIVLGAIGAIALFVVSAVVQQTMLMAIALFGAFACWMEHRRISSDEELAGAGYGSAYDVPEHEEQERGPSRREIKAAERAERDQAELDRILAKISESGMESLSRGERSTLERMSKKKRSG